MNKEAIVFLKHILESIELLEKYLEGVTQLTTRKSSQAARYRFAKASAGGHFSISYNRY